MINGKLLGNESLILGGGGCGVLGRVGPKRAQKQGDGPSSGSLQSQSGVSPEQSQGGEGWNC